MRRPIPDSVSINIIAPNVILGFLFLFIYGCGGNDIPSAAILMSGRVSLTWNEYPDADSYNLYLSKEPGVTTINAYALRSIEVPITLKELEPNSTFYFIVTANTESGESPPSKELSFTVKETPESIDYNEIFENTQANSDGSNKTEITLTWDVVQGASSYNIYWKDSPGVTQNGNKISNVMPPYTIKGLKKNKTYYFAVAAVNPSGESAVSEEFSVRAR